MKKLLYLMIVATMLVSGVLCADAKTNTEVGMLSPYTSLLADSAYDNCSPEDESTVTQLIAEAVRLHGIYNGTGIEDSYDEQTYHQYAIEKGIIYEGLFDNYLRSATRAETIYVLAKAVPGSLYSSEINEITLIPDCDPSAGYYDYVMAFYKAGIVTGYDKYGAFRPGASMVNKDFQEILNKLVRSELREKAQYLEYASDAPFYLIDDFLMVQERHGNIGSGWRYDYTGSMLPSTDGEYKNVLKDISATDNITITRPIYPQDDGTLVLEVVMEEALSVNGITISFDNQDGVSEFCLGAAINKFYSCLSGEDDKKTCSSTISSITEKVSGKTLIRVRMVLDIDNGKATSYVGGTKVAEHTLKNPIASPISQIRIATGIAESNILEVKNVHLYKNYHVNDVFRVEKVGEKPFGYTTTTSGGSILVTEMAGANNGSTGDLNSVKITALADKNANAHKDFKQASGLVKLEAYMLPIDEADGAYFTASYKGYPVFKIETSDGKFWYGNKELYDFSPNIWQCIHVEADTEKQTFLLRINGKLIDEALPFMNKVPGFDSLDIGITPVEDSVLWFDDVEVHEMHEYDDYVPEPQKLETDYNILMSVCPLWRNGSHYGWECIAPHEENTPLLGYYDEGLPETADWEIKFLAEHGVSSYNVCWYAPNSPQNDPIKKPRMVDALHDGYMNAKYSDKLNFSIMFENAAFKESGSYTTFVENIWPFWLEWYFKDDRYFRIDNKAYLAVYSNTNWMQMCCDEAITDKTTDATKAAALAKAKELFDMMEQDLKELGYSGLILTFANNGSHDTTAQECLDMSATGVVPYTWGSLANTFDGFKNTVGSAYTASQSNGIDLLAVAGIGFNDVAWNFERWDLMDPSDFKNLLVWFRDDYMKRYETKYASDSSNLWKSKFIQLATWNEYGEGHSLFPSNLYRFAYLDAIAEVFGKEDDVERVDATPTDEQKARVGHLYPGYRNYIRRKYYIAKPVDIPEKVEIPYDLTAKNSMKTYGIEKGYYYNFASLAQKNKGNISWTAADDTGPIVGTTKGTDPSITITLPSAIQADNYDYIHVKLSVSKAGTTGQFFFERAGDDIKFNEARRLDFEILETGVQDYYIPTNTCKNWDGTTVGKIRIDPGSFSENYIELYCVELMNFSEEQKQNKFNIYIDGNKFTPSSSDTIRSFDRNEIYIAPTEEDDFYKKLHIVYDWNIHTQKLSLETPNGTTFDFEAGSYKVKINGREEYLKKAFEIYDGCPVLPLKLILDRAGYRYIHNHTEQKLEIVRMDIGTTYLDFANYNAESSTILDTFYNNVDGVNRVTRVDDPDYEDNHVWQVDNPGNVSNYFRANTKYEAGKTYTADFDLRLDDSVSTGLTFRLNPKYSHKSDGVYKDHAFDIGNVKAADGWKHFSVTFTVDEDYQESTTADTITILASTQGVKYYVDNFTLRTSVDIVINGDAEDEMDQSVTFADNTDKLEIITDSSTGNRYWYISAKDGKTGNHVYYNQYTEFVPGATYWYEIKLKLGTTETGENVTTSVSINPYYSDSLKSGMDHQQTIGSMTTGGEWKTYQGSFTISLGYKTGTGSSRPRIRLYSTPVGGGHGVSFCIDDFKIYTYKPEHFE